MSIKTPITNDSRPIKSETFGRFKGVDLTSSPFEVTHSRATNMKNLINEDGTNHKRPGWTEDIEMNFSPKNEEIFKYPEDTPEEAKEVLTVNGVNAVFQFNEFRILFFHNDRAIIYKKGLKDYEPFQIVKITGHFDGTYQDLEIVGRKISEDTFMFAYRRKEESPYLKLNWMINYLKYNFEKDLFELTNIGVYIPETTISINADSESTSTSVKKDSPNLLSTTVKNGLIMKKPPIEFITLTIKAEVNGDFKVLVQEKTPVLGTYFETKDFDKTTRIAKIKVKKDRNFEIVAYDKDNNHLGVYYEDKLISDGIITMDMAKTIVIKPIIK